MTSEQGVPRATGDLGFASGLISLGLITMPFLWPIAIFITWYGDCFSETCPAPTDFDLLAYRLDIVLYLVVLVLLALAVLRRSRTAFLAIGLVGTLFVIQSLAGVAGWRGFYAMPILLPASLLVLAGSIAGIAASRTEPALWASGSLGSAMAIGCAGYVAAYLFGVALLTVAAGQPIGLVLAGLLLVAMLLVGVLRQAGRERR